MDLRRARSTLHDGWRMLHQSALAGAQQLSDLAYDLADSDLDDDDAAARFRQALIGQPKRAPEYCLGMLGARETRSGDRAYRLAKAAVLGAPVEPITPSRAALIDHVVTLENMPIEDAYARLVALVPHLNAVVDAADPIPAGEVQRLRWDHLQRKRISSLVGPRATHDDPLVRTFRMHRLVLDYMRIAAGDTSLGDGASHHREIVRRRTEALAAQDGYSVEHLSGGRVRVSAGVTFGEPGEGSSRPNP